MSENRKSVFFQINSLDIIRLFSTGRLNAILERYEWLIDTKKLDKFEEIFLIENLENYWLDEGIRLFNEYRNIKNKN